MISIEILKVLSELLRENGNYRFEGGEFVVFPFNDSKDEAESLLLEFEIRYDVVGESEIVVSLRQFPGMFYDCDHFLRESINEDIFNSDIGILFYTPDEFLYYEASTGKSYVNSRIAVTNFFVQNTHYYLKFFNYFDDLDISEYNSSANHEFILVDPHKGKFLLGYPVIPPSLDPKLDLKQKYTVFENSNKSQEFRLLLKRQIVDSLLQYDHDEKFPNLVWNIESIVHNTENDYEVFLRKFNFEELKKNFRKERDAYFENVRGIVDRLLSKVVSIPISVSAAAITIYNLKDDPNFFIITIVSLAYVVYSLFTSFLLRLLHLDSYEVKQELNGDLQIIAMSSNIPEGILEKESLKVYKKIDVLNNSITILQLLLCLSSLSILLVSFIIIALSLEYSIFVLMFVFGLQLLVSIWGVPQRAKATKLADNKTNRTSHLTI